jgi:ABC-type molybdate transport system substrate-binding protein
LPAINKAFERLGIVEELKAKNVDGRSRTALAPGEAELNISFASEILSKKDLVFLGLLPAEVQVPAIMSAGVCADASDAKSAEALIQFPRGPAIEPALRANGMQRWTIRMVAKW